MEWPQCNSEYNSNWCMPRIIIKWGHSICEKWIRNAIINFLNGKEQLWPEWSWLISFEEIALFGNHNKSILSNEDIKQAVNSFPKNLSLLKRSGWQIENSPEVKPRLTKYNIHSNHMKNHPLNTENQETGNWCHNFCEIHQNKAVEAFWVEDRWLLWLEWIVSNSHKGHEIATLTHGYSIQKQELVSLREILKSRQNKIEINQSNCQIQLSNLIESERECKSDIDRMFNKIIEEIDKVIIYCFS